MAGRLALPFDLVQVDCWRSLAWLEANETGNWPPHPLKGIEVGRWGLKVWWASRDRSGGGNILNVDDIVLILALDASVETVLYFTC